MRVDSCSTAPYNNKYSYYIDDNCNDVTTIKYHNDCDIAQCIHVLSESGNNGKVINTDDQSSPSQQCAIRIKIAMIHQRK